MTQSRGASGSPQSRLEWTAVALSIALVACAACSPLLDVAGAFFPAWLFCILAGIVVTVLVRDILSLSRLEGRLGPLWIVYPSLATAVSLALWLLFYRHAP
jgi:hypothetical protein